MQFTQTFTDVNGDKVQTGDQVYILRYNQEGQIFLYACVVGKMAPQLREIQLATHGPNGPETLTVTPGEIYKNPVPLLKTVLNSLEKMKKSLPDNIMKVEQLLAEAEAGTVQKADNIRLDDEKI